MKGLWWKILSVLLILYSVVAGLTIDIPDIGHLGESVRNLFFHTCMWFVMIVLLLVSVINSIRFLSSGKPKHDWISSESVNVAVLFGVLGIITGTLWAKYAWGQWWLNDPKLNGAAVALLAYLAYIILRESISGTVKKARISAVYNIFAFVLFILFVLILPKLSSGSIHPGDGSNSAIPVFELDARLRIVFYPAIIGWILFALWIIDIKVRFRKLKNDH